jgi:hypothetical protein
MRKLWWVVLFLSFFAFTPLYPGTFYLYIEEQCNGEAGQFLATVRIGIFDAFFTAGHIIFDDGLDKGLGGKIPTKDLALPLARARAGGADFLIAAAIVSTSEKIPGNLEKISSTCSFFLYEAGTGRLMGSGSVSADNRGKETEIDREKLGLMLGQKAAGNLKSLL